MADIHVSYKIETIVEGTVKPGDEIKGKMFLRNEEQKVVKVKYAGVWVVQEPSSGNLVDQLKRIDLYKGGKIEPGETVELDFAIKLPSFAARRTLSLFFMQKTGMIPTQGKSPDEAECVLPIPGSHRMPHIGKV